MSNSPFELTPAFQGHLEIVGPLAPAGSTAEWTGSISLDDRLKSGELSREEVNEAIDMAGNCYVFTSKGASVRCIDGRSLTGYDESEDLQDKLGPQVPGGTVGAAVCYRLSVGENFDVMGGMLDDVSQLASINWDDDFLPGDHTDDSHGPGKIGCRAVDGVLEDLNKVEETSLPEIESAGQALLGEGFSQSVFKDIVSTAKQLRSAGKKYFEGKENVGEIIEKQNPDGMPVLTGAHKEVAVLVNEVEGTTLHRDHFNVQTGGKIQAFGYDIWRTRHTAEGLFPDDPKRAARYVHARLLMSMTALMDLSDGSLLLAVRKPLKA